MAVAYRSTYRRRRRSVCLIPWILLRPFFVVHSKLLSDILDTDEALRNYVRMDLGAFDDQLSGVEFNLTKQRIRLRQPITAIC